MGSFRCPSQDIDSRVRHAYFCANICAKIRAAHFNMSDKCAAYSFRESGAKIVTERSLCCMTAEELKGVLDSVKNEKCVSLRIERSDSGVEVLEYMRNPCWDVTLKRLCEIAPYVVIVVLGCFAISRFSTSLEKDCARSDRMNLQTNVVWKITGEITTERLGVK